MLRQWPWWRLFQIWFVRKVAEVALYDQHLHSRHSMDSEADPAANVERALALGLDGLTFTEHFDTHPSEWPECRYDYDAIAENLGALRRTYGDRIFIGHGIEVCYQPERMDFILDYLDRHSFDLVILSVHWFDGRALHLREHWQNLDVASGTRLYLETVLEAVRFAGELQSRGRRVFDILGHLDLVKRYTQRYFGSGDIRQHHDQVEAILRACLEADLVPEINLSTLRQGLDEPMPAGDTVRRYAESGGEAMALGSDAHFAEHVGAHFDVGMRMLREAGIRKLAVFKERERYDETL